MATISPRPLSPLADWHVKHAVRFLDSDGWQVPLLYSSAEHEAAVIRSAAGLVDISAFAKLSLRGQGIGAVASTLLENGQVQEGRRVAWFTAAGPCLACQLTDDHLVLLAATTSNCGLQRRVAAFSGTATLVQQDATTGYAGFGLAGSLVETVLQRLTSLDISSAALPPGSCAETNLAGIHGLLVRLPGVELPAVGVYVSWDLGQFVWETLLEAGRKQGMEPIGLEAWQSLLPRGQFE